MVKWCKESLCGITVLIWALLHTLSSDGTNFWAFCDSMAHFSLASSLGVSRFFFLLSSQVSQLLTFPNCLDITDLLWAPLPYPCGLVPILFLSSCFSVAAQRNMDVFSLPCLVKVPLRYMSFEKQHTLGILRLITKWHLVTTNPDVTRNSVECWLACYEWFRESSWQAESWVSLPSLAFITFLSHTLLPFMGKITW